MFGRMKTLAMVALASLSVLAVVSCGDDDKNALCKGNESFIVDLTTESVWIYRVTDYDNDSLHTLRRTFTDTVLIVGDTTIEDDHWYITSIEDELWANRTDGFWVWKDFDDDVSRPYLLAKFPAAFSNKYPVPVEDIHPDTMKIVDLTATNTVPYGTFTSTTYRLSTYQDSLLSLSYYVQGIGKIREIAIPDRETRLIFRTIELIKFSTTGC